MSLRLTVEPQSCLPEYATVSAAFEVRERLDIDVSSRTRRVDPPYVKDYDRIAGNDPVAWADRFDVSKWWFAAAWVDGRRIGGAVLLPDTLEVGLGQTPGVAVLWDLRVDRAQRSQGIGRALLAFVEEESRSRGCRSISVETQDINVAACRCYARSGFSLRHVNRDAYPQCPDEIQLIWEKRLDDL